MGTVSGVEAKESALEASVGGQVQVVFAVCTERKCPWEQRTMSMGTFALTTGPSKRGRGTAGSAALCPGAGSAWLAPTLRGSVHISGHRLKLSLGRSHTTFRADSLLQTWTIRVHARLLRLDISLRGRGESRSLASLGR